MPRFNLHVLIAASIISLCCYHVAARNRFAGTFADVLNLINEEYVHPVDQRELFNAAMDGMVSKLDRYSGYYDPVETKHLEADLQQKFGGIGISVSLDEETQRLTILTPLIDTPAHKAGAKPGDIITAIDGESTEGWLLEDAVDVLRGEPGTTVTVTVLHEGETEPVDLVIKRAIIETESILGDRRLDDDSWSFHLEEAPRIGYVRVASFGQHTAEELESVLLDLRNNTDGLIVDLRGNPGGLLTTAVEVSDLFLDEGMIVSVRGRKGRNEEQTFHAKAKTTIVPRELPLAILIDGDSASASEIVAAALQDHNRAVIVGTRSFGKGSVQNVIDLEGGMSRLKLTTATYWRPSYKDIHRPPDADPKSEEGDWGVKPNDGFKVKMADEEIREYLRWRLDRDVVRGGEAGSDEQTSDRPDPQLLKAVDYIQRQMRILND